MSSTKRIGHYVVSTHWDREWYQSFQDYRFRLVNMLDEVLDTMAREPRFKYFQSDGQVILWEDYLEIRPEREPQIREFARQGRLKIGPWYVLPDEFIVSGESLVRNLEYGLKLAGDLGGPSHAGFVCDLFGHTSQMPQIYRGFGIDSAFVWRGLGEDPQGAVFRWISPDGSEVIGYRFSSLFGYCSYTYLSRKCHQQDIEYDLDDAMLGLRDQLDFELKRIPTSSFLIFDGGDHMEIEPRTLEVLDRANKEFKDVELVFSNLDAFADDLRKQRDQIQRVIRGELREPGEVGDEGWLIPGVVSSRIHLKQANARCENELCLWAEPFSTFAAGLGRPYPTRYLEVAWRHLLQNHPHDSICTCSIDQVHRDMVYRFDQCHGIAAHLTRDALDHIAARVRLPEMGDRDLALIVFNPTADPIDGPVDLTLRFPTTTDCVFQEFFGYEPKMGFRLYDPDGRELPYQYVGHRRDVAGFHRRLRKYPQGDVRHEVDVTVPLKVPAYGYTRVLCKPLREPTRHLGTMLVDDHTIANETLQVSVASNGTLTLTDKRTGQVFERLLTLEERADIGDGWYHGVAVNDDVYTSIASSADVAVVTDGIGKATLKIRVTMQVPERFDFPALRRETRLTPLVVTHFVTLRKGSDHVEVRTEVQNTVRDHRLRVLLPSGATEAKTYLADAAFDVVERAIALRADNARYKELEVETRPQQTWTAVHHAKRGLAIVATGLPESTVRDVPERPIALTLLRGTMRTVFTNGEEGGQLLGHHEFRYLIVPLASAPDAGKLCRLGQRLAGGVRAVQIEQRDLREQAADNPTERTLPPSHGFMSVGAAQAVVTSVRRQTGTEAATIRLFNPTSGGLEVSLVLDRAPKRAQLVDLKGRPNGPVNVDAGVAKVAVKPKQIVTVRLTD